MNKTRISLYSGFDDVYRLPKIVKQAGLTYRLAVVQDTYRPDQTDMYFDAALWNRLVEFAVAFAPGARVTAVSRPFGARREPSPADEMPLEQFIAAQRAKHPDDQDPAEYLMIRDGSALICCIVTEFWTEVGGPAPYADSYTYAIYSAHDLSAKVRQHLVEADAAAGWLLADTVHELTQARKR